MELSIKIEDGSVKVYRGNGLIRDLGTLRPNDEQVCRVIYRAIELGKQIKATEIREAFGA